jgi:DNA-directed RNA polymerase specialized sigma24 family protein
LHRPYSGKVPIDELVLSRSFLPALLLTGTELATGQSWLPVELRRVLRLPETPRACFVLRILEGWSREKCAAVLGIPAETVDEESCAAAQHLARLVEKEQTP